MSLPYKKQLLGATAAMVALSPIVLHEAKAASLSVGAQAVVRQAINLDQQQSVNFGSLSESSAGTVTLDFSNNVADGAGGLRPVGGSPTSGRIAVTSQANALLAVSTPSATFQLQNGGTGTGAANELTVKDVAFKIGGAIGASVSATVTNSANNLDISAKLASSGSQNAGTYTGNFTVNVVYP